MEDVLQKLEDPSLFEEVISSPYTIRMFRFQNAQVLNYLANHSHDLLKNALSNTKTVAGNNSFQVIIQGDPSILGAVLNDELFLNAALEIVNDKESEPFVLGRLSTITLVALQTIPEKATQSCVFIYRLLPHCANPSVFHLFESIVTDDPRFAYTHKWLIEFGFIDYLFRTLETIDFGYISEEENPYFDPVFDEVFSLYQIISRCAQNQTLFPSLIRQDIIDILSMTFRFPPVFVENARWRAIRAMTIKETAPMMIAIIPSAIHVLAREFKKLPAYVISALEMINQMCVFTPVAFDFVIHSCTLQNLLNLVSTFPNSTILLNSFRRFVAVGLSNPEFSIGMVTLLLPFVIEFASTRENRVLAPFCFSIFDLFVEAAATNPKLRDAIREENNAKEFIMNQHKNYIKIIESEYGNEKSSVVGLFRSFLS
ncbi:hypothetical protein TRFO_08922 [Tritrichomonas foetus]|uniref:Uncharacterized protein n=1 Tax=Tritrichomonas foetus TaxID=1144522 RepID=A0A1J4JGN3_9EUKA|nr:hypothetical protein TRFO_08922 [Tritrichomonas foetus]|eukprot:OHS98342.1 hypothetical protein TRFO_08922 [Tritrichomonas foetus]